MISHRLPLPPVASRWPPFAIQKRAKRSVKQMISAMLKQKYDFHWGPRVRKVKSVSLIWGVIAKVLILTPGYRFGSARSTH